jgi:hypothetical protein
MFTKQVNKEHYFNPKYLSVDRWAAYAHQVNLVMANLPKSLLEIGIGNGLVRHTLWAMLPEVKTLDIDPELKPDMLGSVVAIPAKDKSFDMVLAAEILEHLPWADLPKALGELGRVSKKHILISLPHSGYTFSIEFKLPLLPRISLIWKLPHFWKEHVFNGEHYWELGKKGYSVRRVMEALSKAGLLVLWAKRFADDPSHYYFLLQKKENA